MSTFIAVIVFVALLSAIEERRVNKRLWAPGPCLDCDDTVYMDHRQHLWIHSTSRQARTVKTRPPGFEQYGLMHYAYPQHRVDSPTTPEDFS